MSIFKLTQSNKYKMELSCTVTRARAHTHIRLNKSINKIKVDEIMCIDATVTARDVYKQMLLPIETLIGEEITAAVHSLRDRCVITRCHRIGLRSIYGREIDLRVCLAFISVVVLLTPFHDVLSGMY